uniref:Uncharacterized protein n=1 Tax=Anguilla anguilla TaxID=7936 RepID=A0A0E9QIR8_ANGAN
MDVTHGTKQLHWDRWLDLQAHICKLNVNAPE